MSDPSRRVGNRAVNKAQAFFEETDLIFQRISQENDIGVDAILTLARSGPDAGLNVGLQIKGGRKYKETLHVDERYSRRGYANFRNSDWRLWKQVRSPCGFEGHHVVYMNARLRSIWRNSRPIYVMVQDPDDEELYYGNLARMADVEPLDQDIAGSYERMSRGDRNDSPFGKYLARVYKRVSRLNQEQLRRHETKIPLYPDLQLTPNGLDDFLTSARAEARQPIPDPSYAGGAVPTYVTYPDGTVGLSREALDYIRRREQEEA